MFDRLSRQLSNATGTWQAFLFACAIVVCWGLLGPRFHFSDTWQLVINTGTTIVTFLMVFLIQRTQNRDTAAILLKLDELILATKGAENEFVLTSKKTDAELEQLRIELEEQARSNATT